MTDIEIVQAAKDAEKTEGFCELVMRQDSRGVNSAYGIGFLEGAVWARSKFQSEIDKRIAEYSRDGSNPNQLVWSELQALWQFVNE